MSKIFVGIALTLLIQALVIQFSNGAYLTWDEDEKSIQVGQTEIVVLKTEMIKVPRIK